MSGDGKAALTISHCFWKGLEEISALQLCCRCVAWVSLFLKGRNKVDFPFNGNTAHVKSGLSRKGQWINDPRTATVPPPHGTRGASFNTDNYHHKSLQTSLPLATTCLSFPIMILSSSSSSTPLKKQTDLSLRFWQSLLPMPSLQLFCFLSSFLLAANVSTCISSNSPKVDVLRW